jgi:CRISPR-associated endonuclease Csn1
VRKRGEVQYVKEKLADGKWQYKTDETGNKIPLLAKGDSIRGQLHADSFYAAIKQPQYEFKNEKFIPLNDGKGNLVFQHNDKRGDEIFITKKIFIADLKTYDDLEIIIDPNLKYYLQKKS